MDGVLCDFKKLYNSELESNPSQPYPQSQFGFFMNLESIPFAIDSINHLQKHFDVWILTRPSVQNLSCYTEKAQWIRKHLGMDIQAQHNKVILQAMELTVVELLAVAVELAESVVLVLQYRQIQAV
jgi:5'(3')-deoxyribonucleotidase